MPLTTSQVRDLIELYVDNNPLKAFQDYRMRRILIGLQDGIDNAIIGAGGEPTIAPGLPGQYFRWDKTFADLNPTAVGLSNVPNINATNAANISSGYLPTGRYGPGTIPIAALATTGTPSAGTVLFGDGSWGAITLTDGVYDDVTISGSGTAISVNLGAITFAKMQDIATNRIIGRISGGTGSPEELTGTQVTTLLDSFAGSAKGLVPVSVGGTTNFLRADGTWAAPPGGGGGLADADYTDITVSSGGTVMTIDTGAVTLSKMANINTARLLGRVTAATGQVESLTGTQATTLLDTFTSSLKGLTPASGGGTTNFLRADGTWAAPSGMTNPMTTHYDLIIGGASGTPTRIGKGTANQVLVSDGTTVSWDNMLETVALRAPLEASVDPDDATRDIIYLRNVPDDQTNGSFFGYYGDDWGMFYAATGFNPVGSSPNANGGSMSGSLITLQPANLTNPGVYTAAAQTLAGDKTIIGTTFGLTVSGTTGITATGTVSDIRSGTALELKGINSGASVIGHNTYYNSGQYHRATGSLSFVRFEGDQIYWGVASSQVADTLASPVYPMLMSTTGIVVDATYINFGSVAGASGYGFRDNAGRVEFKHAAGTWAEIGTGGGGGGSGTVNTGAINRLAYYAAAGTTVDDLAAITASRALVSDSNGLPVAATTTATEIGYVNGVTSAIQTQFSGKLSTSLGAGSQTYLTVSGVELTANPVNLSGTHVTGTLAAARIAGTATDGFVATLVSGVPTWQAASGGSSYTFSTGLTNTSGTVTANLATGVGSNQDVYGGANSGGTLTLNSTSHATKGRILFGNSAYSEVQNQLVIGKSSPTTFNTSSNSGIVQIINDNNAGTSRYPFQIQTFGDSSVSSSFESYRADGTYSSPTNTKLDMPFLSWGFRGYDGSAATESSAAIIVRAAENFTSSAQGSKMTFEVTPLGAISRVTAFAINPDGSTQHKDRIDIMSAAGVPAYLRLVKDSVTLGVFGVPAASDSIVTGAIADDFVIRTGIGGSTNSNMLFSVSGGDDVALKLTSSNGVVLNTTVFGTSGANKMVTVNNGVLGFDDIPSGGGATDWTSTTGGIYYANWISVGSTTAPTTTFHGAGANPALTLNATSGVPYMRLQLSGSTQAVFGTVLSADQFVTGSLTNDFVIRAGDQGVNNANIIFSTDATTIQMKLNTSGHLIIPSLDTGGTAPTTSGTTKMVVCDADGLLSFADIPSGGGMTNPMTTTGDIIYSSSGSTPARRAIGSTGDILTVASGVPTWVTPSGTYTPTITAGTNVASTGAYVIPYMRVGNTVMVSGRAQVDPTSGVGDETIFYISLPVASAMTGTNQLSGVASYYISGGGVSYVAGTIIADTTNDRAEVHFQALSASNLEVCFTFSYQVV